jgi:hypothetical protein
MLQRFTGSLSWKPMLNAGFGVDGDDETKLYWTMGGGVPGEEGEDDVRLGNVVARPPLVCHRSVPNV